MPSSSRVLLVRMAVFAGVTLGLQLTPVSVQLLGGPSLMFGMSWSMYSGAGRDLCAVAWSDARSTPPEPLDRRAIAPDAPRFLHDVDEIRAAAAPLCATGADVRAEAWCPASDGRWIAALSPSEALCR